jgi:RHS repeat-associated protein
VNGYYTASTGTWTYTYDGDGVRTAKAGPPTKWGLTGQTQYATTRTGLPMVIGETRPWSLGSGADYVWYLYGPDRMPLAQLTEIQGVTSVVYLHHDQQGSTRLVTNSAGNSVYSVTYDPYGKPVATTGANPGIRHGYNGEYTDPETGFQYLRARFYDPSTGQFLTRDPLNALTRSAYGYVGGNPLNRADPSGLIYPFDEDDNTFLSGTCVAFGDNGCDNSGNQEFAAQFYSGMLNGMTFGQGQNILNATGKGQYVDAGSGAYATGGFVGFATMTPFAFSSKGAVTGFSRASTTSGTVLTAQSCSQARDGACIANAAFTSVGLFAGPAFGWLRLGQYEPGIWLGGGLGWWAQGSSLAAESIIAAEGESCT